MLFGPQARGDAEPGSDIDVLVVLRGKVSPCEEIARTTEDVAAISLRDNEVAPCVFVSEEQFEQVGALIWKRPLTAPSPCPRLGLQVAQQLLQPGILDGIG
jgi:predicted nucleotidyltransferase